MKKCYLILISLLLLAALTLPVGAMVNPDAVVFDGAGLLTEEEETRVAQAIADACAASQCEFYFATYRESVVTKLGGRTRLGTAFLREQGLSEKSNIVILTVYRSGSTYYYDMFYYGNAPQRINEKEVNYILDYPKVYDNIKGGNVSTGACAFFGLSAKAYEGRVGVSYVVIGGISLVIALIIGVCACLGVVNSYKRKKRPVEYPLNRFAKMELKEQSDVFTGSFVTRRVIQSGSGGRGGGGGGGGGHAGGR